jgi:predicted nucleic acid-binding protein
VQVLVDTTIWSLALRRSRTQLSGGEAKLTAALRDLIQDDRARLIGPIRQELLSGIREIAQFERIRGELRAYPDELLNADDLEQAARWANQCRTRGVSGSGVDFLICAVATARHWQIFSTDTDFASYAKIVPIHLYPVSTRV